MRQVLQSRSGATVVREVPSPSCEPGGLLVRNLYSVISSGTERTTVAGSQQSLLARARARPDLVRAVVTRVKREGIRATRRAVERKLAEERPMGYSSAGRVIEVGEHVMGISPGDVVACAGAGHANHAEIVSVPANLCVVVPDGVSSAAAAMTTIAAIGLHGIRVADVRVGDRVAVIGCGLVGQLVCRLLISTGADVFALDLDAARCEAARRAGVDQAMVVEKETASRIRAMTAGVGVDHAIITAASGSNAALLLAADIARDKGSVVVVGDVPVEIPRAPMYRKELSLTVSRSYGPGRYDSEYEERGLDYPIGYVRWTEQRNMQAILSLQARGRLRLDDLIDEVVPVGRAEDAYARLLAPPEQRPVGAIVLSYDEGPSTDGAPASISLELEVPPAPLGRSLTSGVVRVGLVGPGGFATQVLVPGLQAAGARLQVVGGGSGPSAAAAQRLGFERVADSERAVLEADDVDAVVIATRHGSHARLTIDALRAGKHVFCEKPLVLDQEELQAVLEQAAEAERVLAVGFNRRFAPMFGQISDFVRSTGSRLTLVYRVSAGRVPADAWVHDLSQGGGRALGEACHFVDTLAALAASPVTAVAAVGHGHPDLPLQARDNLVVSLGFADGSVGAIVYVADGSGRLPKERLEAFCGTRTAILDDFVGLELHDEQDTRREQASTQDKGHGAELAAFVAGVRAGTPPVALEQIANVSLTTLGIIESLRTGTAVRLPA